MNNYRKLFQLVAIIVVLLSIMGCSSTYEDSTVRFSDGTINNSAIAVKDFEIVGPIRVTTEKEFKNSKWSGNNITYDMLLQEAYSMDADDVINIKIDTIIKTTKDSNNVVNKSYSYIANGLAIKYTDALLVTPTPLLNSPLENINSSLVETNSATKKTFDWKKAGITTLGIVGSLFLLGAAAQ